MSTRYKFVDKEAVYFTTSTVVGWCDARLNGTGRCLQEIAIKKYCWIVYGIVSKARDYNYMPGCL